MQEFNHEGGNGNRWVGRWVAIFFNLFSSAIQIACVNLRLFEVKNNIRNLVSVRDVNHCQRLTSL